MTEAPGGSNDGGVPLKTWIAVGGGLLGAFIAVLNIQIVNTALPYIEGGISTGGIYGTWISTAYLIGEIIVVPLTDFLSRVFSLRSFMLANTVLFMVFTILCGQAHTLTEMVLFRGLQGFTGGVFIPLGFTIIISMLPPSKRAIGLAGFSMTATFGPAIGPAVGGYLTINLGWPWVFYANLVPSALMFVALWYGLPRAPMRLFLLRNGDWIGIALLAIGLAALQTVLDDGNVYNWFESPFIVKLCLIAVISLAAFCVLEFHVDEPIVNFRLLARRNFGLGTCAVFLFGFVLYALAFLLPQYLAVAQGYDAQQAGDVTAWTGLPQLVVIPFVPLFMKRIDARALVGGGLFVLAMSCFMNMHLDADYSGPQIFWPNIIRAFGQAVVLTPLLAITMVSIAPQETGAASGLFNMMRNLGGAIGVALIETYFTKREQFHSFIINQHVSLLEPATRGRLHGLQQHFMTAGTASPERALHRAIIAVAERIRAQATIMGYADCFAVLGLVGLLTVIPTLLVKRATRATETAVH
jgi:MFS transporter, DHA2 family, multidrug resistance protein